MTKKLKLKRTVQCDKCPWKVSTNPHEIPDGYSVDKHKNLEQTIAKKLDLNFNEPLKIMACHNSKDTGENAEHCVGWLYNQLGRGNNVKLRMAMMHYENAKDLKTIGDQHQNFHDTLPKEASGCGTFHRGMVTPRADQPNGVCWFCNEP